MALQALAAHGVTLEEVGVACSATAACPAWALRKSPMHQNFQRIGIRALVQNWLKTACTL